MSRRGSSSRRRSTGRSKAAIARSNNTHRSNATLPPVLGLLAVRLLDWADEAGRKGMIHVAASELRAERLASILRPLAPKLDVVLFPPWDCLPYEPALPSRQAMGARMAALRRLGGPSKARVVVTVPDALIQRVPPRDVVASAGLRLRVRQQIDLGRLRPSSNDWATSGTA